MRNAKALLLPFYCEGYDDTIAQKQIGQVEAFLAARGVDTETAPMIRTYAQAAAAAEQYNPYCFDFPVLFPVTWSEPRLAVVAARQFFGMPMILGCVGEFDLDGNRTEMSSTPAAAALRGCLQEMGVPCEFFPGLPVGSMINKTEAIIAAARTIRDLRTAKLGFFGHNFNGITAADFDLSLLRKRLGVEVYTFDVSELLCRMNAQTEDSDSYGAMRKTVEEKTTGCPDAYRDKVTRMCLALESYVKDYDLQGLDLRCHTELSQTFGMTACLPLSILGDRVLCSCEADLPAILTQLILHELSGGRVTTYADLRTFGHDCMDVGACGFAPCSMTGGRINVDADWGAGAGYLTNSSPFSEGSVTLGRLLKYPEGRLALHLATGSARRENAPLREMNCPGYPMARIYPDQPMERFLRHVGANHYAMLYGNVTAAAGVFCRYTQIELI